MPLTAPADVTLHQFFRAHRQLGQHDRAFIAEGVFAVLRRLRSLSAQAGTSAARPLAIAAAIRELGLSLRELEPALSADEQVWAREFKTRKPALSAAESADLPDWLWDALGAALPEERDALARSWLTAAPLDLRVNPLKTTRDAAQAGLAADGIVFVARVKPHTAFRGMYESGLAKMIAIGLGKQAGAAACHARGFGEMARMVPALAEVALARAPIRFGLAVLENAHDQPYKLFVVPANQIMEREPELLEEARLAMPHIPFSSLDVLVIDEIGKNISGDGADPNITGRYPTPFASGGPEVNKQVVLDLSDSSDGNANGVGTADFTTIRLAHKMDLGRTYPNALTSTVPGPVALPMVLPSDRLAFAAALLTCNAVDREPRLMRIKNTLQLDEFWVSTGLLGDVSQNPTLHIIEGPCPLQFDQEGNLVDVCSETKGTPIAASMNKDAW